MHYNVRSPLLLGVCATKIIISKVLHVMKKCLGMSPQFHPYYTPIPSYKHFLTVIYCILSKKDQESISVLVLFFMPFFRQMIG